MSTAPTAAGGLILLYHRVAEPEVDPQLLAVFPQRFAEHLEVLRRIAAPMSLGNLVRSARSGSLPSRAVAITFDDGYADNLLCAKALLEQAGVPATVFVATGFLDGRREFWWDEIERLLLQRSTLPSSLRLEMGGHRHCWELGTEGHYTQDEHHRRRAWNVLAPESAGVRQRIYLEICELLRPLSEAQREIALNSLATWSGVPRTPRPGHRPLLAEEVAQLAADGLIDIGAHTVTHSVVAIQPEADQRTEITASKARLESLLGGAVSSFSYPYGTRRDYSPLTVRLVAEAGFELAVSNFRGRVTSQTDRFQLPRLVVRNWDGDEFGQRIIEEWSRE